MVLGVPFSECSCLIMLGIANPLAMPNSNQNPSLLAQKYTWLNLLGILN